MRLPDLVDVEEIAKHILIDGDYTILTEIGGEISLSEVWLFAFGHESMDVPTLVRVLENYDELDSIKIGEYTGYSYMQENKIHIVIEVAHAMGDYVVIRVD